LSKQKRNVKIISVSLEPEILAKIDEARGSIPRSPWIINHINFNNMVNKVNNTLDTQILKKLIPAFIKNGLTVPTTKQEDERLEELIEEVM
jgi:hypothetical protein